MTSYIKPPRPLTSDGLCRVLGSPLFLLLLRQQQTDTTSPRIYIWCQSRSRNAHGEQVERPRADRMLQEIKLGRVCQQEVLLFFCLPIICCMCEISERDREKTKSEIWLQPKYILSTQTRKPQSRRKPEMCEYASDGITNDQITPIWRTKNMQTHTHRNTHCLRFGPGDHTNTAALMSSLCGLVSLADFLCLFCSLNSNSDDNS